MPPICPDGLEAAGDPVGCAAAVGEAAPVVGVASAELGVDGAVVGVAADPCGAVVGDGVGVACEHAANSGTASKLRPPRNAKRRVIARPLANGSGPCEVRSAKMNLLY